MTHTRRPPVAVHRGCIQLCRIILVTAALLLPGTVCAAALQATPASLATRTVEVDGLVMRVRSAGIEEQAPGQTVVVFESGGSAPLEKWDSILPAVPRFAPLVAYDRAGTGQSAWDSLAPTPERVGARLRRLLSQLEVRPPYILVGHSWGGALVRYFAGTAPEDIAGVLYIDPTDITLTRADLITVFESFGAGAAEYDAFNRVMELAMSHAPAAAYAHAMHESQVRRLRSWAMKGGTFQVAANAGHIVHADDPELVIDAIRSLVDRTR
jgi:pimeloyl-ACP methyl ester carboxylesterase